MRNPKAGPRGRRRAPCMNARSFFLVPPREREEGRAGGGAVANAASLCDPRAPVTRPRPLESRPRPLGVHLAPPPIRPRLAIARAVCARSFPPLPTRRAEACVHDESTRSVWRPKRVIRQPLPRPRPTGERCGLADCVLTRHQHPRPSRKRMRAVGARKAQALRNQTVEGAGSPNLPPATRKACERAPALHPRKPPVEPRRHTT